MLLTSLPVVFWGETDRPWLRYHLAWGDLQKDHVYIATPILLPARLALRWPRFLLPRRRQIGDWCRCARGVRSCGLACPEKVREGGRCVGAELELVIVGSVGLLLEAPLLGRLVAVLITLQLRLRVTLVKIDHPLLGRPTG